MQDVEFLENHVRASRNTWRSRVKRLASGASEFEFRIENSVDAFSTSVMTQSESAETIVSSTEATIDIAEELNEKAATVVESVQRVCDVSEVISGTFVILGSGLNSTSVAAQQMVEKSRENSEIVQSLSDAVGRIDEALSFIDGLARQTNLLALNARIEAARAGEAGEGFKGGADEVKQLARQTAEATQHISMTLNDVRNATEQVIGTSDDIVHNIAGLRDTIDGLSERASEAQAASQMVGQIGAEGIDICAENQTCAESLINSAKQAGAASVEGKQAATKATDAFENVKESVSTFMYEVKDLYRADRDSARTLFDRVMETVGFFGPWAALPVLDDIQHEFVDRDIYIAVIDEQCRMLVDPYGLYQRDVSLSHLQNQFGERFLQSIIDRALEGEETELDYRMQNPVTGETLVKRAFTTKLQGLTFVVGYYLNANIILQPSARPVSDQQIPVETPRALAS